MVSESAKINYRQSARDALGRAERLLAEGNPIELRYAAVELRLAIEALTYEKAENYESDFPKATYETWQPRKLLGTILEINPDAFEPFELSVELDNGSGNFTSLGKERPLSPSDIASQYDALGNYLHTPTLRQARAGGHKIASIRTRCEQIVVLLKEILASSLFNVDFKLSAPFDCMRCQAAFKVRVTRNGTRAVSCPECGAPYNLQDGEGETVVWSPLRQPVRCSKPDCNSDYFIWRDQMKPGTEAVCPGCQSVYKLQLTSVRAQV
ncbi:hypothetical protein X747_05305 [Mesorhizobium sp. LNJC384A00]|uniref:hypothetical protein n=1 Tax=Mesorhizobium sp. LNJC384A00 TaxID=1287268 RepID=UPI0003CE3D33|nr:hypothetical protein [Mesorhizobium sp. LNJC384A00]ESY44722.1 hypothetical protein X747_05305 [Mesorhizobium sp. LNJC384A00]